MHKSKLGGFIIDCCTDDLKTAADFWSQALGLPVREPPGSERKSYRSLHDVHTGLDIEVQKGVGRTLSDHRPAPAPGIHDVPASGTPAMAADSTVSATKSSFSR